MNDYRWTFRVAVGGVGLLALAAAVALVLRIFDVVVAGVPPGFRLKLRGIRCTVGLEFSTGAFSNGQARF